MPTAQTRDDRATALLALMRRGGMDLDEAHEMLARRSPAEIFALLDRLDEASAPGWLDAFTIARGNIDPRET